MNGNVGFVVVLVDFIVLQKNRDVFDVDLAWLIVYTLLYRLHNEVVLIRIHYV